MTVGYNNFLWLYSLRAWAAGGGPGGGVGPRLLLSVAASAGSAGASRGGEVYSAGVAAWRLYGRFTSF